MFKDFKMDPKSRLVQNFSSSGGAPTKLFVGVLVVSLILGVATGYVLAGSNTTRSGGKLANIVQKAPETAQQDNRTFRDFAEGTIKVKPQPKDPSEYTEGTHVLIREKAVPVALTSSVVDLATFEGKKVKVYGETQKAVKEGWLMDVGKVEELK